MMEVNHITYPMFNEYGSTYGYWIVQFPAVELTTFKSHFQWTKVMDFNAYGSDIQQTIADIGNNEIGMIKADDVDHALKIYLEL